MDTKRTRIVKETQQKIGKSDSGFVKSFNYYLQFIPGSLFTLASSDFLFYFQVLLISNLPMNISRPDPLFNLFSFYGDVYRVKILRNKLNCALVEFRTATFAMIVRNFMDGIVIDGLKMVVSFSKYDQIRLPEEIGMPPDAFTKDYSGPEFAKQHR